MVLAQAQAIAPPALPNPGMEVLQSNPVLGMGAVTAGMEMETMVKVDNLPQAVTETVISRKQKHETPLI